MRRALSLLAFGATLFTASAQLGLGTIKAVDTSAADKDSWSVKGATIDESITFDQLSALVGAGISVNLLNSDGTTIVDTVEFDEDDCKFLRNEQGVVCRIKGARLSVKLFTSISRTKATRHLTNKNHSSTPGGKGDLVTETLTFWKVAGTARGRHFLFPLTDNGLVLSVVGLPAAEAFDCEEKTLAHGQQRLTCVPVEVE